MRYDCIIVGTGPAGLEAAINLTIRKKKFLLFGKSSLSSKLEKAPKIENYLGFPEISGMELANAFRNHLKQQNISIQEETVSAIYPMEEYYSVATASNVYESTAIILATGVYSATAYPGENEFLGKGVGYCATCDAPLYKGKTVAIVGTSPHAEKEANFVAEIAKTVYYIPVGASPTLLNPTILVKNGKIKEIRGTTHAQTLVLDQDEISADGFFILRESISPSALIPGIQTNQAHIAVDLSMSTNMPGCFAAGDCTGTPYQYIRAAGQGLVAAHSVVTYLDQKKYN